MKFLTSLTEPVRSLNIWQVFKFKYLMLFLMGAMPTLALADNLFTIPSGDISVRVLSAIFGGLVDETSGVKADPMMAAIKMFNGSILIIGGILAAYTILAGTLGTAHDGEMLGKKFSSVWIPIRYSVGTALVLPVVGGGYCVMQAIVMWLVLQGIGLADQVWSSFMSNPTSLSKPVNARLPQESILKVATGAFTSSICYQSYAKTIGESSSLLKLGQYNYSMTKTPTGYVYGDSTSNLARYNCGQVNYPQKPTADQTVHNPVANNPNSVGYLGGFDNIFAPMDMKFINTAHNQQTDILVKRMDELAKEAISNPDMSGEDSLKIYNEIEKASVTYIDNMEKVISSANTADGYEKIKKTATEQGWILAGAWFTRIVQMNDRLYNSLNSTPTSEMASPKIDALIFSDAAKYLKSVDLVLSNGSKNSAIDTFGTKEKKEGDGEDVAASDDFVMKLEQSITESITGMNLYELKNDARHPLIVVHDLGASIVGGTLALMTSLALLSGTISMIPVVGKAVPSVLTVIQIFMGLPMQTIMTVALGCQYIIPNLPYLIWIGCIVGWVLLVIEAIIAAPLWAIMHLHPNGDDLTGRGGNGYMLVLSLLLRPVLMVFGMMASIVISSVIGEFINKTFFEVFANNSGAFTGWSALLGLTMGTFLYFTVMFTFIRKCFSIMHMLPDQLMKWIGGGGGGLGEFAGEFNGAAEKATGAAAALAGAGAGSAINKGLGKFDEKAKNIEARMGTKEGVEQGGMDGMLARNMYALNGRDPAANKPGVSPHSGVRLNADGSQALGENGQPISVYRNDQGENSFSQFQQELNNKNTSESNAKRDSFTDAQAGAGTSAFVTNAVDNFAQSLGPSANTAKGQEMINNFRSAYTSGIIKAAENSGPDGDGRVNFSKEMSDLQSSNFAGTNPIEAANNTAQNVSNNAIMASVEPKSGHLNGASEFISRAAMGSDGIIDKQKAHMFANSLSKLEKTYVRQGHDGAEKVEQDLKTINSSADPQSAFKYIYDHKNDTAL